MISSNLGAILISLMVMSFYSDFWDPLALHSSLHLSRFLLLTLSWVVPRPLLKGSIGCMFSKFSASCLSKFFPEFPNPVAAPSTHFSLHGASAEAGRSAPLDNITVLSNCLDSPSCRLDYQLAYSLNNKKKCIKMIGGRGSCSLYS